MIVQQGRSAVTRFANSFIHQNVADDWHRVRLKVVTEGRLATGTTNRLDAASLDRLVEDTLLAATYRPVDPDWPGVGPPEAWLTVDDDHYDKDTHFADPASRAEVVKEPSSPQAHKAMASTPGPTWRPPASAPPTAGRRSSPTPPTTGPRARRRWPRSRRSTARRPTRPAGGPTAAAGSPPAACRDLDGAAAGRIAADKARAGANAVDIEPGVYEVVLEPAAVADMVGFLADGFSAKSLPRGHVVREGQEAAVRHRDQPVGRRPRSTGHRDELRRRGNAEIGRRPGVGRGLQRPRARPAHRRQGQGPQHRPRHRGRRDLGAVALATCSWATATRRPPT